MAEMGRREQELIMKLFVTVSAIGLLAVAATAQNYNAFKSVTTINDVTVTQSGDVFTVTVGSDPTISRTVGNGKVKTSSISDITGFWLLGSSANIAASQQNASGFKLDTNTGGGSSAYGWSTQNKNGLAANSTTTFIVNSLNQSALTNFGFSLHATGIPDHIKIPVGKQAVPEPTSVIALASCGVLLIRKRKKT
jgi:hypothetical protein